MATPVTSWEEAVRALGGTPQPTNLRTHYEEAHRKYHNYRHAEQVVRDAVALTTGTRDRALVALAGWAHDVVYNAEPGVDERASAAWTRHHLTAAGVPEPAITRVEALILATATHTCPPTDRVAAALLDADLAILASPPADYARYRAAVRAEYAHLPAAAWRDGRAAVLRSLLVKAPLYRTEQAHTQWEPQAIHNLKEELKTLTHN
jgi:predicted metal-dependent HD superfamily phosphohydrolase